MQLLWTRLEPGCSGHEAAYALLKRLAGDPLPPIVRTPQGKPFFQDSDLHFSLSHTAGHAFCCVSRGNVGMDAEETDRSVDLRLAQRFLSPDEKAYFDAAPDKRDCLLRLWVLKESYAKLTGRGIGNYLKNTAFSPDDPAIQVIDGCYVAVLKEGDCHAV